MSIFNTLKQPTVTSPFESKKKDSAKYYNNYKHNDYLNEGKSTSSLQQRPSGRRITTIQSGAISSVIATFIFLIILVCITRATHFLFSVPSRAFLKKPISPIVNSLSNNIVERRALLSYIPILSSVSTATSSILTNSTNQNNNNNINNTNLNYNNTLTTNRLKHLSREDQDKNIISLLEQWKDENFAAQHLSIYVYNLPKEFNTALVDRSHKQLLSLRDPYCDTNFYSSEVHVHRFLLNSSVRVMDPLKADLFYVPIYTTCDLINYLPNNLTRVGNNFKRAMKFVQNNYAYWNQSNGRDHIFLFSQGFSARLAGDWTRYKNSIFMVHNGEFTAPEYTTHKDFTIPPYLNNYFQPIWLGNQKDMDHFDDNKVYLGQFGGQVIRSSITDHRGSNHSKGVRNFLVRQFYNDPDYRITGHRSRSYVDDIKQSIFCFAPEGWHPWTPRPYYGILLGCIPVIISEVQEMAFEEFINWDSFVIWIKPQQIKHIDTILRSIPRKEVERRREAMRRLWRVFWYGDDGLGFQAILRTLYLRKMDNRPSRTFSTIHDDYGSTKQQQYQL